MTNENHFPKTISQWEFDYGLFTNLPTIIVARNFSLSSFKLKRGILPLLTKYVLKTTCHTKLNFSLWTKLLENLLLAKYLISVVASLIFILTKHRLCDLGQCYHYIESSPLIYGVNWWNGFYIMATLDWNKLIPTTTFSVYYFFLSWRNPLSLRSIQPKQTYFSQKHKTQNANWKFSQQKPQIILCSFEY